MKGKKMSAKMGQKKEMLNQHKKMAMSGKPYKEGGMVKGVKPMNETFKKFM